MILPLTNEQISIIKKRLDLLEDIKAELIINKHKYKRFALIDVSHEENELLKCLDSKQIKI